MHSPLSMQDAAHLRDASGPWPLRTRSSTPPMTSSGLVPEIPAGLTLGQTSTHLPHRVQASSMSSTRSPRAVSKESRSSAAHIQLSASGQICHARHVMLVEAYLTSVEA